MDYLDKDEQEIINSFNNDEWVSVNKAEKGKYVKAAKESLSKNRRINIRLTERDYNNIQVKAIQEGIPYQTLIASIIHKYNNGELKLR